jgi:hypothetical protein
MLSIGFSHTRCQTMARVLTTKEVAAVAGIGKFSFDQMLARGALGFTCGVARPTTRNTFIAPDAVFARVIVDFARVSRIPQAMVAALVRLDNVTLLDAIVRLETPMVEPLGLMLVRAADSLQLAHGTELELRNYLFGPPGKDRASRPQFVEQTATVNLTALVAGVRGYAEKAGIDLGAPLFLMPDDPRYVEIARELREIREMETARLERAAAAEAAIALRQRLLSYPTVVLQ